MKQTTKQFIKWFTGNVLLVISFLIVAVTVGASPEYCALNFNNIVYAIIIQGILILIAIIWNYKWHNKFQKIQ